MDGCGSASCAADGCFLPQASSCDSDTGDFTIGSSLPSTHVGGFMPTHCPTTPCPTMLCPHNMFWAHQNAVCPPHLLLKVPKSPCPNGMQLIGPLPELPPPRSFQVFLLHLFCLPICWNLASRLLCLPHRSTPSLPPAFETLPVQIVLPTRATWGLRRSREAGPHQLHHGKMGRRVVCGKGTEAKDH